MVSRVTTIFLVAIIVLSEVSSGCAQQKGDIADASSLTWQHYAGGFVIDLPNLFKKGIETNTGIQWFNATDTSIHDEYEISVDCLAEHEVTTAEDIKKSFGQRKEIARSNGDKITYELLKPNYFVVSGTLKDVNDDFIWYSKGINRQGRYYELTIRYMPKYRPLFDSILPRIAASFH